MKPTPSYLYAVALGSNRAARAGRSPHAMIDAALAALDDAPLTLLDASPIMMTPALGPSQRRYANGVALVASPKTPDFVMQRLHLIEESLGRRRQRRWGPRSIDLDLILWSEGSFADRALVVPHPEFRHRGFVLAPLAKIAPEWTDPLTGLSVRQLHARLLQRKPVDRSGPPL
jgi:2-amino-4-hydroxy-6-hydroxymethyldihydropteridine diphosphokinase